MPWIKMAELLELTRAAGVGDSLARENVMLAKLLEAQTLETRRLTKMLSSLRKDGFVSHDPDDAWKDGRYSFTEVEGEQEGAFMDPEPPGPPQEVDPVVAADRAELGRLFGFGG